MPARQRDDRGLENADAFVWRARLKAVLGLLERPGDAIRSVARRPPGPSRHDAILHRAVSARKPKLTPPRRLALKRGARQCAICVRVRRRTRIAPRRVARVTALIIPVQRAERSAPRKRQSRKREQCRPHAYSTCQSSSPRSSAGTCEQSALCSVSCVRLRGRRKTKSRRPLENDLSWLITLQFCSINTFR